MSSCFQNLIDQGPAFASIDDIVFLAHRKTPMLDLVEQLYHIQYVTLTTFEFLLKNHLIFALLSISSDKKLAIILQTHTF